MATKRLAQIEPEPCLAKPGPFYWDEDWEDLNLLPGVRLRFQQISRTLKGAQMIQEIFESDWRVKELEECNDPQTQTLGLNVRQTEGLHAAQGVLLDKLEDDLSWFRNVVKERGKGIVV